MLDKQLTDYLAGVVGIVEATSFERLCLWEQYHVQRKYSWDSPNQGFYVTVGHVIDLPVVLSLYTVTVNGHRMLFIEPTSRMVDHNLIENWLRSNLSESALREDGKYLNKVDAMNFHNVFPSKE